MIQFTPTVGVAPGTTTMSLGNPMASGLTCLGLMGQPCPPEPQPYRISVAAPKAAAAAAKPAPGLVAYNPYADLARLKGAGLAGASAGSFFMPAALAFAAIVGYGFWHARRKG